MKKLLFTFIFMTCLNMGNVWAEVAQMAAGTNGSAVIVNGHNAMKVGTSSKGGNMTVTVGAGAKILKFYAAAWKGVSNLSINITPAAKVSPSSISLTADNGIANNSPYTLMGREEDYKFSIALSEISQETTLTFTSSGQRFVIWGATYTTDGEDIPDESTNSVITYTANMKLTEVTSTYASGLHTNAFNVAISNHTFSAGTGTITFSGKITSIGECAFYGCSGLTSITIPNSVTSIGEMAFLACSGLTSITIPNSVTSIGDYAFEDCTGLTSVTIPNSVTSIRGWAFYNVNNIVYNGTATGSPWGAKCVNGYVDGYLVYSDAAKTELCGCSSAAIGEIVIPSSVTSIGEWAFSGCSGLTSITIPESVTSIGELAFSGCYGLTSITIGNSVTSIGTDAFHGCSGLTSITIPNSVTSIGEWAFSGCSGLTSITIPESVTSIGDQTFSGCSGLTSITIPNSVTSIGGYAFGGCTSLKTVVWNARNCQSPSKYSYSPFYDIRNYIESFVFGDEVETIPSYLCYGMNKLISVTIPNSVTSIGDNAFYDVINIIYNGIAEGSPWGAKCVNGYVDGYLVYSDAEKTNLVRCNSAATGEIIIPNSVTTIGESAFEYCRGITSITIPNSVTSIGYNAFNHCSSLTSVTIPNSVTSIGNSAFKGCSGLTSVTIPNSVTSIGNYTFYGCSGLTSITIPNSVTSIGSDAFSGCSSLTSVAIPNSVTSIGYNAFNHCSSLTSISIPNSVTSIGAGAFESCSGLTSVTIPNSVTSIGADAFKHCSGLTSVTIPNSVTSIGNYAFCDCSSLTSITIPNSVTSIGESAFEYCHSLPVENGIRYADTYLVEVVDDSKSTYIIKDGTKWIGDKAFSGCSGLTSITIPNSVTSIGNWAFYNCSGLTSITIPNSVTSIEDYAFRDCSGLTTITIPSSVTSIGDGAFYGCDSLKTIYNASSLDIVKGAKTHGYVAYYADNVYVPYKLSVTSSDEQKGIATAMLDGVTLPNDTTFWSNTEEQNSIILTATTKYGNHFVQWSDGFTDNPRVVELTRNTVFVAEFERNSYSVTVASSDLAKGVVAGDTTVLYGDTITISATPATGFQFNGWSDGNTDNPRIITLTQDTNLVANFGTKMCTLTIISNIDEAADITGAGTYAYGTAVSCAVDVMTDYLFVKWGNGKTANPYKFKIYDDMTLYAFFEEEGGDPIAPDSVVVTPNEDNANLQWPQVDNAQTYTMTITKGGETICTLTFNGLGQLVNIDFSAPSRGTASATAGFNFTITGLQSGTTYSYSIVAKDEKGEVLSTETGTFTTTGLTALDAVNTGVDKPTKFLRDGQILIQRGNTVYNLRGQKIK